MMSMSRSSRLASSLLQQRTRSRTVAFVQNNNRRKFSAPPPSPPPPGGPKLPPPPNSNSAVKTDFTKNKGPVSWMSLFLVGVAAASVTAYYKLERERRLEKAMRKVVSSESDGWSPNPEVLAKRKFKRTPWGWFPEEDAFGAGECSLCSRVNAMNERRPDSIFLWILCIQFRRLDLT